MLNLEQSSTPINNPIFKLIVKQINKLSFAKHNDSIRFIELTVAEVNVLLILMEDEIIMSIFQDSFFKYHANIGVLSVPLQMYEVTKEFFDNNLQHNLEETYEYEHEDEMVEVYNVFNFNIFDVLFGRFVWKFADIQVFNRLIVAWNFQEYMNDITPHDLGISEGRMSEFFEGI